VKFATRIVRARGHVPGVELQAVKAAGYNDAEIIEIISHVALNTLTNYINNVTGTEVDFPAIAPSKVAA